MRKGTTPTHTFVLPITADTIKNIEITYSQNNEIVLQKDIYDCTIEGNVVSVTLSQLETFAFADNVNVEIQVRALDHTDHVLASTISSVSLERCLSDEVLQ